MTRRSPWPWAGGDSLGVPMLREGEPLGVIVVGWAEAGEVPQRQEDLLKTFADQAVIAIENVRLFDEVQARTRELAQSVEELRALGEVSQAVNSTLDLETVLNTIVAKAVQLSRTDAGAIYVLNKAHTKFKLRATYGMDEATVAAIRHSSVRPGETASGQAIEQRQPIQIADVLDAPAAGVLDVVVQAGYRSILIVPSARAGTGHRRAGHSPQGAGRVPKRHHRSAADLRRPVRARHP
jgi:GAF domain-containing protein